MEYADERLAEIEAVAEEKNPSAVKTALANYESNVALATEKSKEVKDKEQAENLFTSIADNASRNQEVLSAVLIKVPEEAKAAITQAIEASRKGQEEATKQIAELKGEIEKLKKSAQKQLYIPPISSPPAQTQPSVTPTSQPAPQTEEGTRLIYDERTTESATLQMKLPDGSATSQ